MDPVPDTPSAEPDHTIPDDRAAARSRDAHLTQAGRRNTRADILAYAAVAGLIGMIWVLLIHPITDDPARDMLLILSGALVAIVKDVYGFEFGSSRGSEAKTEQISQLMAGTGTVAQKPL